MGWHGSAWALHEHCVGVAWVCMGLHEATLDLSPDSAWSCHNRQALPTTAMTDAGVDLTPELRVGSNVSADSVVLVTPEASGRKYEMACKHGVPTVGGGLLTKHATMHIKCLHRHG